MMDLGVWLQLQKCHRLGLQQSRPRANKADHAPWSASTVQADYQSDIADMSMLICRCRKARAVRAAGKSIGTLHMTTIKCSLVTVNVPRLLINVPRLFKQINAPFFFPPQKGGKGDPKYHLLLD
jgi:hypothetical protein